MRERREKKSERKLRQIQEERERDEDHGILELFQRDEPQDQDAPLSRSDDDEDE